MKKDKTILNDLNSLIILAAPTDQLDLNGLEDLNDLVHRTAAISAYLYKLMLDMGLDAEKTFRRAWLNEQVKETDITVYKLLENVIDSIAEDFAGEDKNEKDN